MDTKLGTLIRLLRLRIADKSWRTPSYSQDCGLVAEIFVLVLRSLLSRLRIGSLPQPTAGRSSESDSTRMESDKCVVPFFKGAQTNNYRQRSMPERVFPKDFRTIADYGLEALRFRFGLLPTTHGLRIGMSSPGAQRIADKLF